MDFILRKSVSSDDPGETPALRSMRLRRVPILEAALLVSRHSTCPRSPLPLGLDGGISCFETHSSPSSARVEALPGCSEHSWIVQVPPPFTAHDEAPLTLGAQACQANCMLFWGEPKPNFPVLNPGGLSSTHLPPLSVDFPRAPPLSWLAPSLFSPCQLGCP